jgi:DNA polymerase III delta subunit
MIIFLYGPDSYRRKKRLDEIAGEYKKKHSSFSREYFDLSEEGKFEKLREFARQMLIFDSGKLAVLKNVFDCEDKRLKDFLKRFIADKSVTLIISEDKSAPAGLRPLLSKAFLAEKFEELGGEKLRAFLEKEAQTRGVNLSPKAAYFLADSFKGDVQGAINEIEKISLAFPGKTAETSDLFAVGEYRQFPNIFSFINSISSGSSVSGKITALEEIFLSQEEPAKIFNIISAGKRLSPEMLDRLADYDIAVKSGKLEYEEVLVDLALV